MHCLHKMKPLKNLSIENLCNGRGEISLKFRGTHREAV